MTVESDTEWLRERLKDREFHSRFPQKWIAVCDEHVVHDAAENAALAAWLEQHDPDRRCVLAFTDDRLLA